MCFSPAASFGLAGVLAASGAYCVRGSIRGDRTLLPLAVIPVVFAVQQFCEGWVWIGVMRGDPGLTRVAAIVYLFFALLFWPVWVPCSMLLVERAPRARWFLVGMTGLGLVVGLGLMLPVVVDPAWLAVEPHLHSLHYNIGDSPIYRVFPGTLWEGLYLLVVTAPLFVSSFRDNKMVHCGVVVVVSAAVSYVFFDHAFASVWCFLAAGLSLYLCTMFSVRANHARRAGACATRA